eukprot:c728_g1_i1.p1 GENE.c728_g1_i1~~c728_g1_i1.p1  ORF type:complete len:180 (+),score=18.46 c728_g1_i1:38-577(+)
MDVPQQSEKDRLEEQLRLKGHQALQDLAQRLSIAVSVRDDLLVRSAHLNATTTALEQQKDIFTHDLAALAYTTEQLDEWMKSNSDRLLSFEQQLNIDDIVVGEDVRTAQLLELVGLDRSLKDTIYFLDKAFERKAIGMSDWLKAVRSLAKEQYMARALVRKIVLRAQGRVDASHHVPQH